VGNPDAGIPPLTELRGCHAAPVNPEYFDDDGNPYPRCLRAILREVEWWPEFVECYEWASEGFWPYAGGAYDQSYQFMIAMRYFKRELQSHRKDSD